LRLVAVAVAWHHQALGDAVRDVDAEVAAHQVQQHVEARRRAGRGDDALVFHVQHALFHGDAREAACHLLQVAPVRGGLSSVEQTRMRKHEGARADRADARTTRVGLLQDFDQG
jgi:hypothetical protein